jgi:hypothetical protein
MIIQPIGILENCLINSPKSMRLLVSHSAAGKESHFFLFLKEEILRFTASG